MGVRNFFKKGVFSGQSVKRWAGVNYHKENLSLISRMSKVLFKHDGQETTKNADGQYASFEECMRMYNLTEDDLKKRMKNAKQIFIFCLIAAVLVFIYMIYMFTAKEIISGLVCAVLSVLMLVYGLREHFNLFQMKQRRLGCSYKEWIADTFRGK